MNLTELKALAKAAQILKHPHHSNLTFEAADRAYRREANPRTVLELIALCEQMNYALQEAQANIGGDYTEEIMESALAAFRKAKGE